MIKAATLADVVKTIGIPLYIHSLESIARDFAGIPVYAVFQPVGAHSSEYDYLRREVSGRAKGVIFYDMQADWIKNNFYPGSFISSDLVHLSNVGHQLVADYLASLLLPFVRDRCQKL
jgi:hypothetical protein